MDRNREARRSSMVASSNGISRRRHRTNSLRDSPDEDGLVEFSESVRSRERGKKDRDRDRDRDRERERSSRSKRRREDDSSQESVNDDEDDEDDDNVHHHHHQHHFSHSSNGGVGSVRSLQPNLPAAAAISITNHHQHSSTTNSHHQHHQNHHPHQLKTFPPSTGMPFRAASVIGVSVPRKARSAHTKRSHDWISSSSGVAVNTSVGDHIHLQASTSPVTQGLVSTPLSPSSSNASGRRKIKANGSNHRPPKSSSKSTSSNPEELEIEIAEVLYGLMTQSQAPLKKENAPHDTREVNNRSSGDSGSPSPAILPSISNSSAAPFSAVAPKRKRPRQVPENQGSASVRSSPSSATAKAYIDPTMKVVASSPKFEKGPVENGGCSLHASSGTSANLQGLTVASDTMPEQITVYTENKLMKVDIENKLVMTTVTDELPKGQDKYEIEEVSSPKKESPAAAADVSNEGSKETTASITTKLLTVSEVLESQGEEKIQIDLMALPPQFRSSQEREGTINCDSAVVDQKTIESDPIVERKLVMKHNEDEKLDNIEAQTVETIEKNMKAVDEAEQQKRIESKGRDIDLCLDLEKLERDSGNKFQQPSQNLASQLPPAVKTNNEEHPEKANESSSLPRPLSMDSWPGGLTPLGYMAPLQGVLTMDGSPVPSAPLQTTFSQPRPKRCSTHCYIARNISLHQQFIKMNPFWLPTASPASLFVSKACNLNVVHTPDPQGNIAGRGVSSEMDKEQGLAIFPGLTGKDKGSQALNGLDPARKHQILMHQALPPLAPNNLMPGHTFFLPLNQQQASSSIARPGPAKSPASTGPQVASNTSNSAAGIACATSGGTPSAVSYSYPNMPPNETPLVAILQNNAYFPIPAMGAQLNYTGTHAPSLPLFNGTFCSSQMIHPSQFHHQQQQPTPSSQSQQVQQGQQITRMSSSSSSSHKHLQNQQKRPQGVVNGSSGSGNLHSFHASKGHAPQHQQSPQNQQISPAQAQNIENELGSVNKLSSAESQGSRAPVNTYNQNCVVPIHPSNFCLMTPSAHVGVASATSGSGNQSEKKQHLLQQQGLKTGVDSLPPHSFAMSFNGAPASGIDISSLAQNNAIFQSLPEARRKSLDIMAAPTALAVQPKKNYQDDSRNGSGDPTAADDERKSGARKGPTTVGQSITFSKPDVSDSSGSKFAANSIDSSRSITLASGSSWTACAATTSMLSNAQLQAQLQHKQQPMMMQQQQLPAAVTRSKAPPTSNGFAYSDHSTPSNSVSAKFPNTISAFPQNLVQTSNNGSSMQSPLWKGSAKTSSSQVTSTLSSTTSLKNLSQQQLRIQPSHTQISFGVNQKSSTTSSQGHHPPHSNHSQSSTMVVGSPTTSSISKGAIGSPRTSSNASMSNKMDQTQSLVAQQGKSISNQKSSPASGRNAPPTLGNNHIPPMSSSVSKTQVQQHLAKGMHQSHLFFSSSYAQAQPSHSVSSTAAPATSGYYIQTRRPEQPLAQQSSGSTTSTSATGMLTLCPVTLGGGGTSDPAKAIASAASDTTTGGLPVQGILHTPTQFSAHSSGNQHQIFPAGFSYVQPVSTAVQVKPTEQKQQAGNDNLHACWQSEKK